MNKILITFFTVILCLTSSISFSETLQSDQLLTREGVTYKKFSIEPFNGIAVTFYKNGQLQNKTTFSKGLKEGESTEWFPNGKLRWKYYYTKGKSQKEYVEYYENGSLKYQIEQKDGNDHGDYSNFFSNGQKNEVGKSFKGQRVGLWKTFNKNGILVKTTSYEFSETSMYGNTKKIEFWKNGKVIKTINF